MSEFKRMQKQGERLEKFVKGFIAFVFIMIIVSLIAQGIIVTYFIKNPDSIGSWIGELIQGFGFR